MKSAAFISSIAYAYSVSEKTVAVQARFLREAGLLTTGARGVNAPDMTPLDAARLTIAVLVTDSPSQTVERVKRFGKIKFSPNFKKAYSGYENIGSDRFSDLFEGETLEEVLAHMFSLPSVLGIEESSNWFWENGFHLRISDFEVLAELFKWKMNGDEIIGETVVPFKGDRNSKEFEFIKGGIRTQRTITGLSFLDIGVQLMTDSGGVI